ncbi:MAG TPA: acyl-CoA dehydrogenase family protein [Kofleriaceae bacterium]|nr:acyl-CoA dehydrogenase family protein [Kofleriaceae bacterium]
MDSVLRRLLDLRPPDLDTLDSWWAATRDVREHEAAPVDRALVGGALANRLGFAFSSGYHEALRALVGGDGIYSLCVTEARGNSPKDIDTTLTPAGDGYVLTGRKKWATGASFSTALLVAATTGVDSQGRNQLRIVRVPVTAAGVKLVPATTPFVPEIPHAEVELDRVAVRPDDLLPGDGYADYVKPFRTVEDAHVHAALLGYLVGVARRHELGRELIERLLATVMAIRGVALADPRSPTVHLALAGAITQSAQLVTEIEREWEESDDDEWKRWQRDRALLRVAGAARVARRDRAWQELSA